MPTRKGSRERQQERVAQKTKPRTKQAAKTIAAPITPEPPKKRTMTEAGKAPRRNALFPIGINYYPLNAETDSWDDWYAHDVEEDFKAFAESRMTLVRLYLSWKVLEPQVGQYDEDALERLQDIIDVARNNKLQVIICFFAEDRLSEMVDVPWGKKRDSRSDDYLIERQVSLIQKVVNRLRSDTAVFGWDLANEAFCSGFQSSEGMLAWVTKMRDAVREVDTERPIIISADPETLFRHTGVDPRDSLDLCEFAVSHPTSAYVAYAAEGPMSYGPSTYLDAFLLKSAARDLPVLMDDIGVFGLEHSAIEEAAHTRLALFSALVNRGAGVMLRRYCDLDVERREPYFRDPFEVLVGIADTDRVPKPAMAELEAFARAAARIDLRRYSLPTDRVAVLIPNERYEPLPNLAGLYDPRACLQAFVGAKEAHIAVTVARESDELGGYSVIIVPSAFKIQDETWERLSEYVQAGGSVILSYGGGDSHPAIRDIFGIEFLGDGGARDEISCRVAQQDVLGELTSFDARLETPNFALLGHGGSTVVATDAKGSPVLTVNQLGQGRAVYVAFPVERALAQGDPWAAPPAVAEMLRTVYGAVADAAGCGAPVECDTAEVEIALFNGEEDDIVVLLNHAPQDCTAELTFDRPVGQIADVRGGKPVSVGGPTFGVPIEASGVVALRLVYE